MNRKQNLENNSSMTPKIMKSMPSLPDDVVENILVKLPVNALLKLQFVCKSWYGLIKSPYFIAKHYSSTSRQNDNVVLIKRTLLSSSAFSFHSNDNSLKNIAPICEIPDFDRRSEVLGPCNGIVCITDNETSVLCNPATREFKLLPRSSYQSSVDLDYWPRGVGFGVDSDSIDSDFKVVIIMQLLYHGTLAQQDPACRAELYSLRENSWRQLEGRGPEMYDYPTSEIFFNGCCHWYTCDDAIILSFNVYTEVFEEFGIPSDYDLPVEGDDIVQSLQALSGSLAFVSTTSHMSWRPVKPCIDIWVMKEYRVVESWTKMFHIRLDFEKRYSPLSIWMDSFLFLENDSGQLELCELESASCERFMISGDLHSLGLLVFKQTLISLHN